MHPTIEQLARDTVGDDKSPNLFFVTLNGTVVSVDSDSAAAYTRWVSLVLSNPSTESALEDRQHGTVCSREPMDDDLLCRLHTIDDFSSLIGA
jgi:hypothetical protein